MSTVVRDVRFRRALSLAINREEVIENIFLEEFATLPERLGQERHSVEEANQLLDEMGLTDSDDDDFRLGSDGEPFTIPFDIRDLTEDHIHVAELVAEYWKNVGIHTTVKRIDDTLYGERVAANEIRATIIWVNSPIWASTGWDDYLPKENWGPLWDLWNSSRGEDGEEPPAEIKELYELHGEFLAATTGTPESTQVLDAIVATTASRFGSSRWWRTPTRRAS